MTKNVLINTFFEFPFSDLKKYAISFQKVYLLNFTSKDYYGPKTKAERIYKKHLFKYVEDLADKSIVQIVDATEKPPDVLAHEMLKHTKKIEIAKGLEYLVDRKKKITDYRSFAIALLAIQDTLARVEAQTLKTQKHIDVFPLLSSAASFVEPNSNTKNDVLNFVLTQLPTPDENTSWEQIIEFRNDKDVQTSYLTLINWINGVANSNKPLSDIEDEFNELYARYIQFYNIHKMKSKSNTVEILVGLGIDALTELNSVGQVLKTMFNIRKTKISLMEEELKLPGKEIAYIYKANETFGQKH